LNIVELHGFPVLASISTPPLSSLLMTSPGSRASSVWLYRRLVPCRPTARKCTMRPPSSSSLSASCHIPPLSTLWARRSSRSRLFIRPSSTSSTPVLPAVVTLHPVNQCRIRSVLHDQWQEQVSNECAPLLTCSSTARGPTYRVFANSSSRPGAISLVCLQAPSSIMVLVVTSNTTL
jgi:hypothetical protein